MAKKRSMKSRLVTHSADRTSGRTGARTATAVPAIEAESAASAATGSGGLQIPGLELEELQETVQKVVDYIRQNPVAAVAVAFGAGMLLSAMYWDDQPVADGGGQSR